MSLYIEITDKTKTIYDQRHFTVFYKCLDSLVQEGSMLQE